MDLVALLSARPGDVPPRLLRPGVQVCVLAGGPASADLGRVCEAGGASLGPVFGRYAEAGLRRILAQGDASRLAHVADELAAAWHRHGATCIWLPAWDEADPLRCLARLVGDAASARLHLDAPSARSFEYGRDGSPAPATPFEARLPLPADLDAIRLGLQAFAAGGMTAAA